MPIIMPIMRSLVALLLLVSAATYSQKPKQDLIARAFKAVEANDIATLKILIQDREVLNATYWGNSYDLLGYAVVNERDEAVRILLSLGVHPGVYARSSESYYGRGVL